MSPIEEQRLMREHLMRQLDPKRMQAFRTFTQTAPIEDVEEHGRDNLFPPYQSPGYAEGEMMPPSLLRQRGDQALRDENIDMANDYPRDQPLEDAMVLKDLGYLGPPDPERYPFATDEAVRNKRLGLPIGMRSAPMVEQQAMQDYVRQRLLAQQQQPQLNLDPGQVPLAPEDRDQLMQRPPLPGEVEPPPRGGPVPFAANAAVDATRGGLVPGVQSDIAPEPMDGEPPPTLGIQGGTASRRLRDIGRDARQALPSSRVMARKTIPF